MPVASASSVTPAFAKFGAEGILWVAIVEKAFAHHRSLDNSYRAIEFGSQVKIYQAMGSLSTDDYGFNVFWNATQLANQLFALWNNYRAVCVNLKVHDQPAHLESSWDMLTRFVRSREIRLDR